MRTPRRSLPRGIELRARWMSARSRNVLRRPFFLAATAAVVFVTVLVALLAIPRRVNRVTEQITARVAAEDRPDTSVLHAAVVEARGSLARAESLLAVARARNVARLRPAPPPPPSDTLTVEQTVRRDSLRYLLTTLTPLIQRADDAPLPASYRALGDAAAIREDPRVRQLAESLATVEREREAFGAMGGIDPIFIALTARLTEIGQTIQDLAEARRDELRSGIAALEPAPPPAPPEPPPAIDTLPLIARRDSAVSALTGARERLTQARGDLTALDEAAARARSLANVAAPPYLIIAASLIVAVAIGFGIALVIEMRRPRVANAREIERLLGIRVITTVRPHAPPPDRTRRRADLQLPPLIVATDEAYRALYLHLLAADVAAHFVTVTGRDAGIAGVVAANLAVRSAYDARSTLLVDGDLEAGTIAGVLRTTPAPGLAEVLEGQSSWAETTLPTTVGRDRVLYVVPAGDRRVGSLGAERVQRVREELERLTRRYDAVILAAPITALPTAEGMMPRKEAVLCAHAARTPLGELTEDVETLQAAGITVRGIVLWDQEPPAVMTRDELAEWLRLRDEGERADERTAPAGAR